MKKMKRFASLALALVMALAMAVPAFAANNGTITISNATIGETYSIYKIFDATYSGTDNENASYTITEESEWYNLVRAATDLFTLNKVGETTTYNVALNDGKKAADITAWLKGVALPANNGEQTAESDTVEFTGLPYGYYLVKSSLNEGGTLTLDDANPDAKVIDKNQKPSGIEKTATGVSVSTDDNNNQFKSAQIGDVVDFKITYNATNYDGDEKIVEYYVNDDMPDGFDLVANSIAVKVGDDTLTLTDDYTIAYGTEDTDDFKVTIPWVGTDADKTSLYDSSTTITVTYKATINANAVIDGAGNANTATITHKNDDKDTPEKPDPTTDTDTETVFTYALAIKKVDEKGKPLAGAEFTLKQGNDNVNVSKNADGTYTVNPDGTDTIVSPDDGLIIIKGVEGVEYTLTETKAPEGYNLLTKPVTVTPVKTGEITTDVTKYIDEKGNVVDTETEVVVKVENNDVAATVMVVVNFTGSLLPSTGGIGTTIFYVVGGILVAGAAILLVTRKRVEEQ